MSKLDKREKLTPFVPLLKDTMGSAAWRAMSPQARIVYIALKARYNIKDHNNGRLFLSHRDAMEETGIASKHVIARCFKELIHYGFIVQTQGGCLGFDGRGKAPHWRLTELGMRHDPPTRDFLHWDGDLFQPTRRGFRRTAEGATEHERVVTLV